MRRPLSALLPLPLTACEGVQSALAPQGPDAAGIATLSWIMFGGGAILLLLVLALTVFAAAAPPRRRRWLAGDAAIILGGIALPALVLTALLTYGLSITATADDTAPPAVRIEVVGEQWWWRVRYLDEAGATLAVTANEIRIPAGQPVVIALEAADVIHSFWVPKLAGKLDMIPGHTNRFRIAAERPGVFRGQCAEYCGGAHALMAFMVIAEPRERFEAWLHRQGQPAADPRDEEARQGRRLFLAGGCGACHTVRGTDAAGTIGPDLTHVGGRTTLAAGILPNHVGTLAGWIADAQNIKPGNRMPSFNLFSGRDLRALASYLEGLE